MRKMVEKEVGDTVDFKIAFDPSIDKNVLRAVSFLFAKERFIGRDKP
ncbi:hypothetical protein [Flavobacterium taihuense]|uniref:Uncharacterized protein n=1 Tax=Flavobacterium taihuense TaxID=2857508 RepID=A0ABS6XWC7_9FLAO|nr:hypothetical protein [Flavobacterium taihuense]MBW4360980.1 hypothetical protein [Flavobacterium taihuense]